MRLILREDLDSKMPYKRAILLSLKDWKVWVSNNVYRSEESMY